MTKFILNNKLVTTSLPAAHLLVDFIRYEETLKGTKIGCREGDCGACVVLVGELVHGDLEYRSLTSCLTPLANVHHKHVVTVEGINMQHANPIQQAMTDASATQCGFCTPGFVMSLAGFSLSRKEATVENGIAAVDGNICRCTGYKSIERAIQNITTLLENKKQNEPSAFLAENNILPKYFSDIKNRLQALTSETNGEQPADDTGRFIGGGTDLYVQVHETLKQEHPRFLFNTPALKTISREGNKCIFGASVTVSDLQASPIFQELFPSLDAHLKLVSSTPIRNIATVAGNFVNASPIGDLTIFFIALDAQLVLSDGKGYRELPLKDFYKGYKSLDKTDAELIVQIWFTLPAKNSFFHFEKGSKRTWLDIATANTAISITVNDKTISSIHISAGGVGPVPLYLRKTANYLDGKELNEEHILQAIEIMQTEITPIDDVRGTAHYKRLLLSQLVKAHFITLFAWLDINKLIPLVIADPAIEKT